MSKLLINTNFKKITTNIPLTNEEEALENIESQILKYMRKMFVIDMK